MPCSCWPRSRPTVLGGPRTISRRRSDKKGEPPTFLLDILALLREELMEVAIDGFASPVRREDKTPERSRTDALRTAAVGAEPVGQATRLPPPVDPLTAALYAAT
jgi:hypothetical protein